MWPKPRSSDALQMGVKAGMTYSTCKLNVWLAGKTVWSLIKTCLPKHLTDGVSDKRITAYQPPKSYGITYILEIWRPLLHIHFRLRMADHLYKNGKKIRLHELQWVGLGLVVAICRQRAIQIYGITLLLKIITSPLKTGFTLTAKS